MAYSDEREYSFSLERFTGIDQGLEGNDTPMHASRSAENCNTSGGVLKLATGWAPDKVGGTAITNAPGDIRTLMKFFKNNPNGSTTEIMVAATDNNIYKLEGRAWVDIAGSNPITSGRFSWINYQKKDDALLIMANGTDNVYCWNGAGKISKLAKDANWAQGQPMWDQSANIIRLNRHGLTEDCQVVFEKHNGALPSNINEKDTYFVYKAAPDTFQISATKTGSRVDLKGNGKVGWRVARAKWLGSNPTANYNNNTITLANHGLMNDDGVVFDHFTGSLPNKIQHNTVYYAIVLSNSEFQISKTINNPEDIVDFINNGSSWMVRKAGLDTWLGGAPSAGKNTGIFTLTNHGLKNGTAVEFGVVPADVLPGGIIAGTTYYVKRIDGNNYGLFTTAGGKDLDISTPGGGGWAMRGPDADEWLDKFPSAINTASNTFTLENHGFADRAPLVFGIADENSYIPNGLYAGHTYYVKRIDNNRFRLLSTPGALMPVDISSVGMAGWAVKKIGSISWLAAPNANPSTDEITIAGHSLLDGDAVILGLDEARLLPGGLTAGGTYYVRDVQPNLFKLAASVSGGAIDLTGAGRTGWRIRPADGIWKMGLPTYNISSNAITLQNHGFKVGDAVVADIPNADGFMPGGIVAHNGTPYGKFYYVVKATASTFMVSDKPDGAPIITTSTGSNIFRMRISRENRPMGSSLALHYERVWAAGERSRPNSVFFSDDMDPTNWAVGENAAGEIKKPTWDGDAITAIANLFDCITVFKSGSMFRIAGTSPGEYQIAPVLSTTGTVSPATICQWQNAAFFLSPLGIMAYDGTKCDLLGGDALKDFWATMNTNRAALAGACAVVHNGHLLVALPTGSSTINNCVVDFSIAEGTFMLHTNVRVETGIRVDSWLPGDKLRFASERRICIWGQNPAGAKVYTYGEEAGNAIPMRWETPKSDFGSRDAVKTVTCVSVTGKGGALKVTVNADEKSAMKTVQLPDEPHAPGTVKARFNISGRLISVILENDVSGNYVEVSGVTIFYERDDD